MDEIDSNFIHYMIYMQNFEDLYIWQEAIELYHSVSSLFDNKDFKHYFFKDQILRATLSISNNIAEGFERESKKELIRFLYIAKGSCGEVRSMLHIATKQGYINIETLHKLIEKSRKISIMIQKYINTTKKNIQ